MSKPLGFDETPTLTDSAREIHPSVEQFTLLIDGRIPAEEATAIRNHLVLCAPCERVWTKLTKNKPDASLIGQTIAGEFKIQGFLDEGGMGALYTGLALKSGRDIVLKVLLAHARKDPNQEFRLTAEWEALMLVKHPNIVELLGFGKLGDGRDYLVLERLRGETLSAWLKDRSFSVRGAMRLLQQLLSALVAMHAKGVLHRDLKPSNLMLIHAPQGLQVKVLDFGLAKQRGTTMRTQPHLVLGSAGFVAPEQLAGQGASEQSDLYAVGCVAWRMLTGKPVFGGGSEHEMLMRHIALEPPKLSSVFPNASPQVDAFIERLLAPQRERRFVDARAALQAVVEILATPSSTEDLQPDRSMAKTVSLRDAVPTLQLTAADQRPTDTTLPVKKK